MRSRRCSKVRIRPLPHFLPTSRYLAAIDYIAKTPEGEPSVLLTPNILELTLYSSPLVCSSIGNTGHRLITASLYCTRYPAIGYGCTSRPSSSGYTGQSSLVYSNRDRVLCIRAVGRYRCRADHMIYAEPKRKQLGRPDRELGVEVRYSETIEDCAG